MMPAAFRRSCLLALTLAAAAASGPAWAEGNRLLPFWGQPYPYGYAYRTAERERPEPCSRLRRHGQNLVPRRCVVVLHARD